MRKLIVHTDPNARAQVEARRLEEHQKLTPQQRIHFAFQLMEMSLRFKKGPLKQPQGLGIVFKRKVQ